MIVSLAKGVQNPAYEPMAIFVFIFLFGRATAAHYWAGQRAFRYKLFKPQMPAQKGFPLQSRAKWGGVTRVGRYHHLLLQ
jgi:hypothetical protein